MNIPEARYVLLQQGLDVETPTFICSSTWDPQRKLGKSGSWTDYRQNYIS